MKTSVSLEVTEEIMHWISLLSPVALILGCSWESPEALTIMSAPVPHSDPDVDDLRGTVGICILNSFPGDHHHQSKLRNSALTQLVFWKCS